MDELILMVGKVRLILLIILVSTAGVIGAVRWIADLNMRNTIIRLSSTDATRRLRASEALISAGPRAVMPLIEAMAGDDQETLRLQGVGVLAQIKDQRAVPLLVIMLEKAKNPEIRKACAENFVAMGTKSPAVMSRLEESLQSDDDASVRSASLTAFVKLAGNDATPQMISTLLRDRDLRPTVLKLFQYHGDTRALPILCRMLLPYKKGVSDRIARTLGRLKDERALPFLWSAWDQGQPKEFVEIVESSIKNVLGRRFRQEKYGRLVRKLQDESTREKARKMLLSSLPDSAVYLDRAAHDEDQPGAEEAQKLLRQLFGMLKKQETHNPAVLDCYTVEFEEAGSGSVEPSARASIIHDERKLKGKAPLLAGRRKVDFAKEAVVALDVKSSTGYAITSLALSSETLEAALAAQRSPRSGSVRWLAFLILEGGLARFDSIALKLAPRDGAPPITIRAAIE